MGPYSAGSWGPTSIHELSPLEPGGSPSSGAGEPPDARTSEFTQRTSSCRRGSDAPVHDGRMRVRIGCRFEYDAPAPTPSVWQVRPRLDSDQLVVDRAVGTACALALVSRRLRQCLRPCRAPPGFQRAPLRRDDLGTQNGGRGRHGGRTGQHRRTPRRGIRLPAAEPFLLARHAARCGVGAVRGGTTGMGTRPGCV